MALVLGSASGVAYAAIPDSGTGVITACRATSGGALRVIDAQAGSTCGANEKQLTWNGKGIRPRGAYSSTVQYRAGDSASLLGSSYVAVTDNKGIPVSNSATWQVLAARGAGGPPGPAGSTGGTGPTGPPGPPGPSGGFRSRQVVVGALTEAPANTYDFARVDCPAGMVATGGGMTNNGFYNELLTSDSSPDGDAGWAVFVSNVGPNNRQFQVQVVCLGP